MALQFSRRFCDRILDVLYNAYYVEFYDENNNLIRKDVLWDDNLSTLFTEYDYTNNYYFFSSFYAPKGTKYVYFTDGTNKLLKYELPQALLNNQVLVVYLVMRYDYSGY